MGGKTLKYAIMGLVTLVTATNASGCPTCMGRLRLGIRKPFFELHRPQSRSKYAPKRGVTPETLSFKKTDTSPSPSVYDNDTKEQS